MQPAVIYEAVPSVIVERPMVKCLGPVGISEYGRIIEAGHADNAGWLIGVELYSEHKFYYIDRDNFYALNRVYDFGPGVRLLERGVVRLNVVDGGIRSDIIKLAKMAITDYIANIDGGQDVENNK